MFLDNKYTRFYMSLMDDRKKMNRKKTRDGSYDLHHIVPKFMGGSDVKSNKVLLTPREHFISHLLLTKMLTGLHKRSAYYALVRFLGKNSKRSEVKINSKTYQSIIEENRKMLTGKNNPFYGKTHTPEFRKYISELNKELQKGKKNGFYGKTHTEEAKFLLSLHRLKPFRVYFFDGTSILFGKTDDLGIYLGMSTHLGGKLLNPTFRHIWKKYNIQNIIYEN